jgi:hypothetical protein
VHFPYSLAFKNHPGSIPFLNLNTESEMPVVRFKKPRKPVQDMDPEVETEVDAANEEEFPEKRAWEIEMEAMRRQIVVLTEQFQKYKPPQQEPESVVQQPRRELVRQQPQAPPFMGYHRDFDQ